jgi:dipeptidyl-peptidase-3
MHGRSGVPLLLGLFTAGLCLAAEPSSFPRERVGDHAVVQLEAPGFTALSAENKRVAWYLSLASHAGEPILYDQRGWRVREVKRLLEGTYLFGLEGGPEEPFTAALTDYLTRFYAHTGNHVAGSGQKFVPTFTFEQLHAAARRALAAGAPLGVKDEAALAAWLGSLRPVIFDPAFEPLLTASEPAPGADLHASSASTFYGPGVTLEALRSFRERHPLNSRVVKQGTRLVEQVYRAGTPDGKVRPGLYAEPLRRVISHLERAASSAPAHQRTTLRRLVTFLRTGELRDWDAYNIAWLAADPPVDANFGFIETYLDTRGLKGEWDGYVYFRDPGDLRLMEALAERTGYFEERMPWPDAYKRQELRIPVARAITVLTTHPRSPVGINLPNEQHVRERYGSKSVLVVNAIAVRDASDLQLAGEFVPEPEDRALLVAHGAAASKVRIAFHEVLGHASGKVAPTLKGDPATHLRGYYNALEEARADLVMLWHAWDPALAQLGFPEHEQVARALYLGVAVGGLTNLLAVREGDTFTQPHLRGRQLIVNYLREQGVIQQERRDGKTYLRVTDYPKMREHVGALLSRLMTIKATGDRAAIQELIEKYGTRLDPALRDEVVRRADALQLPRVLVMSSPRLRPVLDARGALVDVGVTHEHAFLYQHLERSVLGRVKPEEATRLAAGLDGSLDGLRRAFRELPPEP